jgi:hypothetical protein
MAIRAVVFDIGGDADPCVAGAREAGLHAIRYRDNAQAIAAIEALLGGEVP